MRRFRLGVTAGAALLTMVIAQPHVRAEVLLQYFETEWDEIYQRLPEIAEIGYEGLWIPPPQKSPHAGGPYAGGGNVGYSHVDRFDIGDKPQRGSLGTRYGTRYDLRNMVDNAHQCDIKIYPDIVFNHTGNGPNIHQYPGLKVNDFHGWWDAGQPGGFKRAPRMSDYSVEDFTCDGTFQQELVSLFDMYLEEDQRFSAGGACSGTGFAAWPAEYIRHPGCDDLYPYGPPEAENVIEFSYRWMHWLGEAIDYDGVRLDAPKHCVREFFGKPGSGFNHEIQVSFDFRDGNTDLGSYADLYENDVRRKDALIFSEFFIGSVGEVDYWRNWDGVGVKMRYLDFPRKSGMIKPAFNDGNLGALAGFGGFSENEGVVFVHSHDENAPWKLELAYVYALTHVGLPVVYFTGNNLDGADVGVKTWVKLGYGGALGDYNNGAIPNLVYINNQFARGKEWNRWTENDFFVFERYDDIITANDAPDSGEGLLLVGLNDSGANQTRNDVQTAFAPGTTLHDYSGNAGDLVVDGSGQVDLTIPAGINGQGWVCYAPYNAPGDGDPLRFTYGGTLADTINWVVPGGNLATNKPRNVVRITNDTVDIDIYPGQPADGGYVDYVTVKWGEGEQINDGVSFETNNLSLVHYGFQPASSNVNFWRLTATLTNLTEGLHLVKGRCFNNRPGSYPPLFQTFQEAVYVDRHGPDLDVSNIGEGSTVQGDTIAIITNSDRTAYMVDVSVDGGSYNPATMVMRSMWKFNIAGLSSGVHTMDIRAIEADYGDPRTGINTSFMTRTFTVDTAGPAVSINFQNINNGIRSDIELPFFKTIVTAPGASNVKLYWDGFEVPLEGGGPWTNVFDGRYIKGGVTSRFWGAFINGEHCFKAEAVSAGETNCASVMVTFNLYGADQIDSDGDGLPDNLEMPFFETGTAPGPNVPWPGDTSGQGDQDMIPNYGETWTRLNPMNNDTDYDGVWDADEDSDFEINSGDSVPNGCEVRQGYLLHDNIWHYSIYNSGEQPSSCVESNSGGSMIPATVGWSPEQPRSCPSSTLAITYEPNEGPLSNSTPIHIHIGYNNWSFVTNFQMNDIGGGQWQYVYPVPTNATDIEFAFRDAGSTIWDTNNGNNWTAQVGVCVSTQLFFNMDGNFDSDSYQIAINGMKLLAAVKSQNLYVATWSANGGGNDHFLYVTDEIGAPEASPWAKAGQIYYSAGTKPHLVSESDASDGYHAWNNGGAIGQAAMGSNGNALEGELNLADVFGSVPDVLYMAAVAYGDNDGQGIAGAQAQAPVPWSEDSNLEPMEFICVPIESIRDNDCDGYFDCGRPTLLSVVNGNTNDANYNIRRFYLDELMGDTEKISFIFEPNTDPGDTITDVELISNVNRRDFAVIEYDLDNATTTTPTNYFRAYAMTNESGVYTYTLEIKKTGAYRATVRYKVNGQTYYYTDKGMRRDLAIVVTPKTALCRTMYELNPMAIEATGSDFEDRSTFRDMYTANTNKPDIVNSNHFPALNVNLVWLQPIHPIGTENRQTDPETGQPYDPGSPFAIRNYWEVNSVLGDPSTRAQAMDEFQNWVRSMDEVGVSVMLDAPFNHSAWDCEIGSIGVDMFAWATNETDLIRDLRPQWYSKIGNYGERASFYNSPSQTDIAPAPDRFDFGKWNDAADFNFGVSDTLVQGQTEEWRNQYLSERDCFFGHDQYSREIWNYFAEFSLYWLEQTDHPAGTPKSQSFKGIDGLRCDFAQGLPSQFWEYVINRTRAVKWDFLFMAESLDGFRTVPPSSSDINAKRHGLSYRSARHFDILNENIVFYWRDTFFAYPANGPGSGGTADPSTSPTATAFDNRRQAYDNVVLLNNLTSHDEVFPSDDPYRTLYAYAEVASMDGIPLIFYGQEAGAQNSVDAYGFTGGIANDDHNWGHYETNFGKAIPNFKRYNYMQNVWSNRDWNLQNFYGRINWAKLNSQALKSQQNYFLDKFSGGRDEDIFAVARFEEAGVSAASQDVVFVFVSNDYTNNPGAANTFDVDVEVSPGVNWFGIDPSHMYNVQDLISSNPTEFVWGSDRTGQNILDTGIFVGFPYFGAHAHYLKLVDTTEAVVDSDADGIPDWSDPDDDNDGLPDWWEILYGLDPNDPNGDEGPDGDKDMDGISNKDEYYAGTHPNDGSSLLEVDIQLIGNDLEIAWGAVRDHNYRVEELGKLDSDPATWNPIFFGTAYDTNEMYMSPSLGTATTKNYRVIVVP